MPVPYTPFVGLIMPVGMLSEVASRTIFSACALVQV